MEPDAPPSPDAPLPDGDASPNAAASASADGADAPPSLPAAPSKETYSATITEASLGISLREDMVIIETVAGGAASRAGLRVGDSLLSVGGAGVASLAGGASGPDALAAVLAALRSAPRPLVLVLERPPPRRGNAFGGALKSMFAGAVAGGLVAVRAVDRALEKTIDQTGKVRRRRARGPPRHCAHQCAQ